VHAVIIQAVTAVRSRAGQPPAARPRRAEDWAQWWQAAEADGALADAVAERAIRRLGASHHATADGVRRSTHTGALRAAGFAEVGPVWQHGPSRVLCAIR
jgi:hypothetical protein